MLTIYAPMENLNSKAWEVFGGVMKSWPTEYQTLDNGKATDPFDNSMFWGFVNNNLTLVHKLEQRKDNFWFTDTPYFCRFDNKNLKPDNHWWRICRNNIHAKLFTNVPSDRFDSFKIKVKPPSRSGKYILVCPSSVGIHMYLKQTTWLDDTINEIKKHTDRPIKVRLKPRGRGTSGPSEAKVPIEEDLKDAWACVTSCSISAIESICNGVPVFCHEKSFATPVASTSLKDIENPKFVDPYQWLCSLAYQQFTPEEFANGFAVNTIKKYYDNKS
jgi:hypothetical protein